VINRKILCKSGPLRRSTASRSPVLTRGVICVPPTVAYSVLAVGDSTLTAVGRSRLLARWPGTHSRIVSWIQQAAQTVLGVYLKRTCLRVTSASSALGVLSDYALYKPTHSLTHSLTSTSGRGRSLQCTRSTQPCTPSGSLNRVPASAGARAEMSPLPGGR